jgi:AcrR family transcriptional regulator
MAREKDEGKRAAIMAAAKRLFAAHGFNGTSISDLAHETGLPVGSIYTYFENKEALIVSVIEEGWGEFSDGLFAALNAEPSPEGKVALLIYRILPSLFEDVDLISILLLEGARYATLEKKLDKLTTLIADLVRDLAKEQGIPMEFPTGQARTALTLYLLGSLDTIRLSRVAGLGIPPEDILSFIRLTIENTFHIELKPELVEAGASVAE